MTSPEYFAAAADAYDKFVKKIAAAFVKYKKAVSVVGVGHDTVEQASVQYRSDREKALEEYEADKKEAWDKFNDV